MHIEKGGNVIRKIRQVAFGRFMPLLVGAVIGNLVTNAQSVLADETNRTYTNPIGKSPIHMGDPFAFLHQGKYYLIGTTSSNEGFQCYESTNLRDWTHKGWAWRKTEDCWAEAAFWAPEVKYYQGKFYMTYSGRVRDSNPGKLLMGLAVSDTPEGPYRDLHAPWFDLGYSTIDGHIFVDDDGTPYVFFSRNGVQDGYSYGMNYAVQLERDLSKPVGEPVKVGEASQLWERVKWDENRCNEGAFVLKHEGRYYMTYSANHTGYSHYGVGYATADKPLGPWTKAEENPVLKTNLTVGVSAPGHNSIVTSPDGTELFIVYHTHANPEKPSGDRVVNIDRLEFTADGKLRVIGPTRTPQLLPSGVEPTNAATRFSWSNPLPFEYEALGMSRRELRDPCIVREGDTYYLTFTVWPFANREESRMQLPNQGGSPGIQLHSTKDFKNWKFENWLVKANELPEDCPYKNRFWAPEIHKIGGKFYLIFTADNWIRKEYNPAGTWGTAGYAFVGVADKITGPYEHITYIDGGACDTSLFEDADGKTYAIIPAYNVFVQSIDLTQLDRGEVRLIGERRLAVTAKNDDIAMRIEPDYEEGPWMIRKDDRYWLFYAGPYREAKNPLERCGYWMGVAYGDGPLGPWTKDPRGQVFLGGHVSVFVGPDGEHWFAYRGEGPGESRSLLCIDPFTTGSDGRIKCQAPSTAPPQY